MRLLVTNIQRFSLHDGPGIRTTVFLKGCSVHCPWCCNPENIIKSKQFYYKKNLCIAKNGSCAYGVCPFTHEKNIKKALDMICDSHAKKCKSGAIGEYGRWYEANELITEVMRDSGFWKQNGGVTFSGGEPLLQMDALEDVLAKLKDLGVNMCVETSLFVPTEAIHKAVRFFDEWYIDIKLLDKQRVQNVLGGDLDLYLKNLDIVFQNGGKICLRHPLIKGYTDDNSTENEIRKLIERLPNCEYQVLTEHHLGDEKYISLGEKY